MDTLNFICFSQKDKVCIIISVYNIECVPHMPYR